MLNYFRAGKALSSGVIAGLNNKAKVNMRKAYGFRSFAMKKISLYHARGKLPEPGLAHDFY
jgi:transposase